MRAHNQIGESYPPGVLVGAGVAQDCAARQLEIPAAVVRLDVGLQSLAETLNRLDNRLTGAVARTDPPAPESKNQVKTAMQSGVGQQLDHLNDRVLVMNEYMGRLLDRLEV